MLQDDEVTMQKSIAFLHTNNEQVEFMKNQYYLPRHSQQQNT